MRILLAMTAVAALGLAACEPQAPAEGAADAAAESSGDASAEAASGDVVLAADGEGLRLVNAETGSTNLVPFGAPRGQVLAALDGAGGIQGESGSNAECPPGPLDFVEYAQGITVMFQDGGFAGWLSEEAGLTTMNGIGVGSTAAEVAEANGELTETSLGQEFDIGGVYGIMNEDASAVRILWAGANCFAR